MRGSVIMDPKASVVGRGTQVAAFGREARPGACQAVRRAREWRLHSVRTYGGRARVGWAAVA